MQQDSTSAPATWVLFATSWHGIGDSISQALMAVSKEVTGRCESKSVQASTRDVPDPVNPDRSAQRVYTLVVDHPDQVSVERLKQYLPQSGDTINGIRIYHGTTSKDGVDEAVRGAIKQHLPDLQAKPA